MEKIRPVREGDYAEWLRLRRELWSEEDPADLEQELEEMAKDADHQAVFVAERPEGGLCGLIEVSIRDLVDWCETRNVGYIEGWIVDAKERGLGIGRKLVEAGEEWARSKGCREMASDTTAEYPLSPRAHEGLGYLEVERKICYRKKL